MRSLGRFTLIGLLVTTLALLAVHVAAAEETRSLAGEEFLVQDVTLSTIDCDPSRVSTVNYSASGVATGPYPGTFTVQGTVTIEPQTLPGPRPGTVAGPLRSLSETFTIDSPLGTVTGAKALPPGGPTPSDQGSCQEVTGFATGPISDASGTVVDVFSQPVYNATIQDALGSGDVHGEALLSFSELDLDGLCETGQCHYRLAGFDQFFLTSLPGRCDIEDEQGDPGCQEQQGEG
jgi:hypothetical protein